MKPMGATSNHDRPKDSVDISDREGRMIGASSEDSGDLHTSTGRFKDAPKKSRWAAEICGCARARRGSDLFSTSADIHSALPVPGCAGLGVGITFRIQILAIVGPVFETESRRR